MDIEKLRGEFERHIKVINNLNKFIFELLDTNDSGDYTHIIVETLWQGFQAHAALQEAKPEAAAVPMSDVQILKLLPKNNHRFQCPEGQAPDILVWNEASMIIFARAILAANGEVNK